MYSSVHGVVVGDVIAGLSCWFFGNGPGRPRGHLWAILDVRSAYHRMGAILGRSSSPTLEREVHCPICVLH